MPAERQMVWNEAECARGHAAALEILERVGVEVRHETGRAMLEKAGARVEGTRVRLGQGLVDEALATVPRAFPLRGRDPDAARDLDVRDGNVYFGSGPDCLYILDPHTGERRRAVLADVEAGAALAERLPNIDFVMSMWLPEDVPPDVSDLVQFAAMLTYTHKPIVVSSPRGGDAMREHFEMASLCGGAESFACLTQTIPSLVLDEVCVEKTLTCAELKIPMILETGVSLGSTGPSSLQTAAAVAHAEVMATLVLHQLASPGAPYLCGSGVSQLDMSTFVDLYTAPESGVANHLQLQLAKSLSLPTFDYAGCTDAKSHDEQWAAEIMASTLGGAMCGGTLLHDVGYMESGLLGSFEALVMGDNLAGYARAYTVDLPADDSAFRIDEVAKVGPGGHYLGQKTTRKDSRAWWRPTNLFDRSSHSQWAANGSLSLGDRLRAQTLELLAVPAEPLVDADVVSGFAALIEQAGKHDLA